MIAAVEDRRAEVAAPCERCGVERLDLIVSFERRDPPDHFRRYFGLEEDLEALFGRRVDLVTEGVQDCAAFVMAAGVRSAVRQG